MTMMPKPVRTKRLAFEIGRSSRPSNWSVSNFGMFLESARISSGKTSSRARFFLLNKLYFLKMLFMNFGKFIKFLKL